MVVDDAVVVRGLVSRWIDEELGLKVVASLRTGREAVEQVLRHNPDVVVLDIEMPDIDGIAALPLLLAKKRDLIVIMASTLTRRNAEVSLKALSLGAADYIPKPATNREVTTSATFSARPDREGPPARRAQEAHSGGRPSPRARRRAAAPAEVEPCRSPLLRSGLFQRIQAAPLWNDPATRAAGRVLDRRTAGADQFRREDRAGHRRACPC